MQFDRSLTTGNTNLTFFYVIGFYKMIILIFDFCSILCKIVNLEIGKFSYFSFFNS